MPEEAQPTKVETKAPREAPPTAEETPYPPPEPTSKPNFLERFWFVFAAVAVVCLVGIGALLFLNKRLTAPVTVIPTPVPTPVEEVDKATRELEEQGTSDEIADIEADLNATDLTQLDKELSEIETELSY